MNDNRTLEEKINHIDKILLGIDTAVKHLAEKLADTVRLNSTELANHDKRISGLERSFHTYNGSIATLNRLLSLGGAFAISGIVWLFVQINDYKKDYALMQNSQQAVIKEIESLKQDVERLKYERNNKLPDTN